MVAEQAPPQGRTLILDAARSAFLDGMSSGVKFAAAATAVGAFAALVFLPARAVAGAAAPDDHVDLDPFVADRQAVLAAEPA